MSAADVDIAICGAGPVGLALAGLLVRRGVTAGRVALIDARSLGSAITDPRSIALSWGSRMLLEDMGAWPIPATAIHDIHVSRRGQFGRSMMTRDEHDVAALGYVTRYGELVNALSVAVERAGVRMLRPARVDGHLEHSDGVSLKLDDGSVMEASLVVQAEGGLFGEQETRAQTRDYDQHAVIARVSSSAPVAHRAYERFTGEGPLALLPQDGDDGHQYALVWCMRPESAERILALDDAGFVRELGEAFGTRLGRFTAASARASYKLGLNAAARATARTVAIGNAAQTLHPVAGQGLNLGLRDAAVLARLLAVAATPEQLAGFNSARQADRSMTVGLTDAMARAFASEGPGQVLLGLSLGLLDTVAPARALLADMMMYGRR